MEGLLEGEADGIADNGTEGWEDGWLEGCIIKVMKTNNVKITDAYFIISSDKCWILTCELGREDG